MARGPKPKGERSMTAAERQAAYRERQKAGLPATIVRTRKAVDRRSRPQRWNEAVTALLQLQAEYQDWLDNLPEQGGSEATREALEAICEFDLSELESITPPRGFGRD